MNHLYGDLIGLRVEEMENGYSKCSLEVREDFFNPHGVIHGAIIYGLADSGMGAALYPSLKKDEICATIEIKINYYRPVTTGTITCITEVINRGKSVANMESSIYCENVLVAKANGNYSIFVQRGKRT